MLDYIDRCGQKPRLLGARRLRPEGALHRLTGGSPQGAERGEGGAPGGGADGGWRPPRKGPLPISVEHLADVVASVAEVQRRGKAPGSRPPEGSELPLAA
jgi:hypothetical protein